MNDLHKYATFSVDMLGNPSKINSVFSMGRARIFYKGMNQNRSIIDNEVAEQLASTIPGTPVIGTYNYEEGDFEGHGGNQSAYGFIPLEPHATWVVQEDTGKEYLEVDVVIWDGRFEEAQDILTKEKHLSMELNPKTLRGKFERIGGKTYYHMLYAEFAGITVLGDDVPPCFEDAQFITAFSNMVSAYALYIEEAQKNNEGGKNVMDNITNIVEPEVATNPVEEVVETAAEEAKVEEVKEEVVEETAPAEETETENSEETEVVETVEETEGNAEFESDKKEDEKEDKKEDEKEDEVCPDCGENPCVCKNNCKEDKYSALEAELADYKAKYESLENELKEVKTELGKYTKKEKLEIITKFSTKIEDEELIEKLTNEVDSRSLDEIKNELGQALVEQMSAEEPTESNEAADSNFSLNINIEDKITDSAWDLVKRHKANK